RFCRYQGAHGLFTMQGQPNRGARQRPLTPIRHLTKNAEGHWVSVRPLDWSHQQLDIVAVGPLRHPDDPGSLKLTCFNVSEICIHGSPANILRVCWHAWPTGNDGPGLRQLVE